MPNQFSLFGGHGPIDPSQAHVGRTPLGPGKFYRLFFAIVPDVAFAANISRHSADLDQQHEIGGKLLRTDRLHVTLHVVGEYKELPADAVLAAIRMGNAVHANAFDIVFDRAMTFMAKNNPYVLRVAEGHDQIESLWLNLGIEIANEQPFKRPSFTPHMTLSYHGRVVEEHAIAPIRWTACKLVLINSHYGDTVHEVMASWSLAA